MPLTDEDKNWIRAELASLSGEIRHTTAVAIEATETKLLTAFHQWASPMDARMRTHAAAIRALDLESEALSDRVAKLEPPH
jgi:hypothetical protein